MKTLNCATRGVYVMNIPYAHLPNFQCDVTKQRNVHTDFRAKNFHVCFVLFFIAFELIKKRNVT